MKKLLIALIMGIFLMSMVSSDFLPIKSYDEKTDTVTLSNFLGLGKDYAKAQLTWGDTQVGVGIDTHVGTFTFTPLDEDAYIRDLNLYEVGNKNVMVRGKQYKVLTYVKDDLFSTVCNDVGFTANGTAIQNCYQVENGTYMKEEWKPLASWLKSNSFVVGETYSIGVFVDTEEGDYGDWIPTLMSFEIDEWSTWNASFETGLNSYWNFDSVTDGYIIEDVYGNNDAYNYLNYFVDSKNNDGLLSNTTGSSSYLNAYTHSTNYAINFWINWTSFSQTQGSAWGNTGTGYQGNRIYHQDNAECGGGQWFIFDHLTGSGWGNRCCVKEGNFSTNTFYMITAVKDGNSVAMYINGVQACYQAQTNFGYTSTNATIGSGGGSGLSANIDEFMIWNRSLNTDEMALLYDSGTGMFYEPIPPDASPTATLHSPIDEYNSTSQTNDLTWNATDDFNLVNVSLIVSNAYVYTNSSPINATAQTYNYDFGADGTFAWKIEACDNASQCTNSSARNINIDTTPFIELTNPTQVDEYNDSSGYLPINVSLTETYFQNITWNINGDTFTYTNSTRFVNLSLADGTYEYNVTTGTTTGQLNTTETRNINIDTTNPVISVGYNITDLNVWILPTNSTWHFNASDTHIDSCYYNTSDDATLQVITCNSTQTTNWTTQGSKTIQFCANDTFGFETCNTTSIDIFLISTDQHDDPDPIVEGYPVTFNLTVNRTDLPTTTAYLIFNTTAYSVSGTSGQNGSYFETTINVPTTYGNTTGFPQTWYWNYTIDGVITNQSTASQTLTVYELAMDNCSTYGELILNFSLNDEELNTEINETLGSNIELDLILTSIDNSSLSLSYSDTWTNENNAQVCIPNNVLNNTQWYMNFTVGFDSTDRVWEFYYVDMGILNSTKIFDGQTNYEIDLMDLKTDDSTSFLFNYFNTDGLVVDDIIVHVFRKYIGSGVFREVERAKSDENGDTIVHLVEEDVIYYFLITKYGEILYTSSTYTALCQATPCTIQLEASGSSAEFETDYDLIEGGSYSINESASDREVTLVYDQIDGHVVNFTIYKYNSDGSFDTIDTASSSDNSDQLTLDVPLSAGNVSFFTVVTKNEEFISSQWIDFENNASDRFGLSLTIFLAILIILTLGLVAITEGSLTIFMVILGLIISGALGLITTKLSTGISITIYLILAGGLIVWKLAQKKG